MKAMILSAGYGTRLGHLTHDIPKPMLQIQERPILEYIIRNLAQHSFDQIVFNLHFMPEVIREYFGNGTRFGVNILYSYESELLGTAGGVKKMEDFFRGEEDFLIHYGDIITDQDFTAMLHFHRTQDALVTLLLHQRTRSNSVVCLNSDNRIVNFLERPTEDERQDIHSPWVNSGICICKPELLNEIPTDIPCDLPRDIFPKLINCQRIFGFPLSTYRCAIDSQARLHEARQAVANGACQIILGETP